MDKTKIYLDLSKCTEDEQVRMLNQITNGYVSQISEFPLLFWDEIEWNQTKKGDKLGIKDKTELTYPEFIKLFEGGESKEVLQVENNGWIKSIAISHQKQMSSTHPHAIIGTIEDAIIEALETFKSNQ